MSIIYLLFDPDIIIAEELSKKISYRYKSKAFIAEIKDVFVLCNPTANDVLSAVMRVRKKEAKLLHIFVLRKQPIESLKYIFSTLHYTSVISNIIIISDNKNIKMTGKLLDLFFRSLGIGFDAEVHYLRTVSEMVKKLVMLITKGKLIDKARDPIPISSVQYYDYYTRRAIEVFESALKRNKLAQIILVKYWYKYFGLFQEKFPNWLKLIALLLSFTILDILMHGYINMIISSVLLLMPIYQIQKLGSEAIIGLIRWIIYFFVLTPVMSEIYYIALKIKTRRIKFAYLKTQKT